MNQFITGIEMRTVTCECGITWAAPEGWFNEREKDHKTFFCPNGCGRYFPQESDEERLKRLLDSERRRCISAKEEANFLERSLRAYKGQVTRLKKKQKEEYQP